MNELTYGGQTDSISRTNGWIRFRKYASDGEERWKAIEQYTVVLVLDGEVKLTFNEYLIVTVGRMAMIAIDHNQLTNAQWSEGTSVVEFIPPKKIFRFLKSCFTVFKTPCSNVIPIYPILEEWAEELRSELYKPKKELSEERQKAYCMRLSQILQNYPNEQVGELLVPFQACSMIEQKRCKKECDNLIDN